MPTFERGFAAGRGPGRGDPGFFGAPAAPGSGQGGRTPDRSDMHDMHDMRDMRDAGGTPQAPRGLGNLHRSDEGFQGFEPPGRRHTGGDAWKRWQPESLDPRDALKKVLAAQLPVEPPPPPPIDFAALDAMRDGARKEGYAQGYTQGQTQGYGDGHREGYARGLESARSEAARLQELAGNFRDALGRVDTEIADALISLALDVARQLVRKTMEIDPAALVPAARELINAEPPLSGAPCLLLNPDDVALVETHLQGELQAAGWTLRADPAVARGGCIASAASGELDGTLATRWERVIKALGRNDPWEPPHA